MDALGPTPAQLQRRERMTFAEWLVDATAPYPRGFTLNEFHESEQFAARVKAAVRRKA